ncbi:MAG: HlyD family type I secretion periplasmic adaptor subunit [Proteobacteria bacterium]|nr:HlyD family type I secretion periplasmic adaptor subunit [Pseudomonadota bacterium]MBU1389998.1 HlyD family type I secretion periplasmic adaptor subunit [Pseudomonadota bacterium]MBU1545051.1 HlyD family type I secretion periplasmic adaptor subunit [Pseudomonadota bacterium]MBU2431300.1 HlyD family type I secretion periplasmic adaptor subunit [Pseudomonadota bacterium]MBU2480345.1 HlyD family type I secretion periplasmic adaptor subunit [Pseudomonadota bacterium]
MMNDIQQNTNYLFANLLLLAILAFFAAAIYWASQARLDEVVRGMGRVTPSTQIKIIQNFEGGILSQVLVKEGQEIEKDQILMQLDQTVFHAGVKESLSEKYGLEASIARLMAEFSNQEIVFPEHLYKLKPHLIEQEMSLMQSRKARLQADIDIENQNHEKYLLDIKEKINQNRHLGIDLRIAREKHSILQPLVEKQFASKMELLDLERQINELESRIEDNNNQIPKIEAAIETTRSKINSLKKNYSSAVLTELSDKKSRLEQLEQIFPAIQDRFERTSIRSPVSGLVKRIFVHTVGAVISPGEPLIEVVPEKDELLVEARILPKDIAFIHPGQKVNVKITAYDFSIYGGLNGQLEHISADAFVAEEGYSYFLTRVKLAADHLVYKGNRLPVMAGMDCQVDILSGSKTVMDYMLKPILKARHTALTEP